MSKPSSTEELLQLSMSIEVVRQYVNSNLDELKERIRRLIPENPKRKKITDWDAEVESWSKK